MKINKKHKYVIGSIWFGCWKYRGINYYLDKGRLWLWQCQIFRIFANSANKRQTIVTTNQILTQKWFLLPNIKDSSLNLISVMVFSLTESAVACLTEFRQKFPNLNWNRYMQPKILPCIPEHLWTYVQTFKGFFDRNSCWSHGRYFQCKRVHF
jgi:hypothetical protein